VSNTLLRLRHLLAQTGIEWPSDPSRSNAAAGEGARRPECRQIASGAASKKREFPSHTSDTAPQKGPRRISLRDVGEAMPSAAPSSSHSAPSADITQQGYSDAETVLISADEGDQSGPESDEHLSPVNFVQPGPAPKSILSRRQQQALGERLAAYRKRWVTYWNYLSHAMVKDIVVRVPVTIDQLALTPGMGATKLRLIGEGVLAVIYAFLEHEDLLHLFPHALPPTLAECPTWRDPCSEMAARIREDLNSAAAGQVRQAQSMLSWRQQQALRERLEAYRKRWVTYWNYLSNAMVKDIVVRVPVTIDQLALTPGMGANKARLNGEGILAVIYTFLQYEDLLHLFPAATPPALPECPTWRDPCSVAAARAREEHAR
jgi:hypothetical protein